MPGASDECYAMQREAVERVVAAIAEYPAANWEIDDLAKIARYSRFHFTRVFARHAGMTPRRWLARYRIELAKELLTRAPFPKVKDVTRTLGYASIGMFSSRFTKVVGCSPTSYREWYAYAECLTTHAGPQVQPHRDVASLDPRWLSSFGDTLAGLERELRAGTPIERGL